MNMVPPESQLYRPEQGNESIPCETMFLTLNLGKMQTRRKCSSMKNLVTDVIALCFEISS